MTDVEFITDREIYDRVILDRIPAARRFVWIATADLKDCYINKGRKFVPLLQIFSELSQSKVMIRLLHAKEPGSAFREDFDRFPNLIDGMERLLCPRVHFKCVVVDEVFAYSGSANLTGSGMGAKSTRRRNFESGFVTTDRGLIRRIMDQFDEVWMGTHCSACDRKRYCSEFRELL